MNKMIKTKVSKMKKNMHKMIRAKVIKVNMSNNMERKLLSHIFSIYTLFHQLGPGCSNLNLNTAQCYYVDMLHSPPMTKDKA
jgi:hypothetical protein